MEENSSQEIRNTDPKVIITPEILQKFIEESDEQLGLIETALLNLEKTPGNDELIMEAFRGFHTFKGNCSFMGYPELERLGHKTETILEIIQKGKAEAEPEIIQSLLHMVDVFRRAVTGISQNGFEYIDNISLLDDFLDDIVSALNVGKTFGPEMIKPETVQPEALYLLRSPPYNDRRSETDSSIEIEHSTRIAAQKSRTLIRQDIRVNIEKLDNLINLVGELVIAETMVAGNPDLKGFEFENFERSSGHLKKIIRELQEVALSLRMIPIAGIFRKMIRLVHDLSIKAGKKIELTLSGEDTEIDKTVAELIADPLVHLVRNAVDHGIETPEERNAAGKTETGEIRIEAKHEGGEIWIIINDDGRGLIREKIIPKAIHQGIIGKDNAGMTDDEVFKLIFRPGFSTAETITDISGRGVGMDVVKKNIERINGHIHIDSKPGKGTEIFLRIPLTLAIIDGMIVRVGNARYIIPLLSIQESIQVEKTKITVAMAGQELVNIRGELIPVIRLYELHGIEPDIRLIHEGLIIIIHYGEESAGILVDEIIGEQQAVIKGLPGCIGKIEGISGCTILEDGEIALILDTGGLIRKSRNKNPTIAACRKKEKSHEWRRSDFL